MSPTGPSRTHRVITNAFYNLLPQFWFIGLSIFTTPYILHGLGVDAYGVLAIVTVLAGYLGFLDLGLNLATVRFVARHHAAGESEEAERVVQTSLTVFILIALLAMLVLGLAARPLASVLKVPPALMTDAIFCVRAAGVIFGLSLVLGVFAAVPRALQRFDILNGVSAAAGTAQIAGTVLLLFLGFHLRAIVLWGCVLVSLHMITYAVVAHRLLPALSLWPRWHRKTFRELIGYSGFVMVSNFTGVASSQSEKLILGGLAPIAQVTYYSVPFSLVWRVLVIIPSNLFAVLFPAFSALTVTDKRETLHNAYVRAFRFIFVTVAPISILLAAFGGELLRIWIGDSMSVNGGPVLTVLAFAILINAPAWVSVTVGQSVGRPGFVAAAQTLQLAVMLTTGFLLVPSQGALGAAWAWLVANAVGIPVLIGLVNRYALELSTPDMLKRALLRPVLVAGSVMLVAFSVRPLVHGIPLLMAAGLSVSALYTWLAYAFALNDDDRAIIRSFIRSRRNPAVKASAVA